MFFAFKTAAMQGMKERLKHVREPAQDQGLKSISSLDITKMGLKLPQGLIGQGKVREDQAILFTPRHKEGPDELMWKHRQEHDH